MKLIKRITVCVLCFMLAFVACSFAENTDLQASQNQQASQDNTSGTEQNMNRGGGKRPGGGGMGGGPRGTQGENGQPPQLPGADMSSNYPGTGEPPQGTQSEQNTNTQFPQVEGADREGKQPGFSMGQQNMAPNMRNTYEENNIKNASEAESKSSAVEFIREYQSPLISMVLLILAFVFVIFYKRKRF